jgi:hypothetical protein
MSENVDVVIMSDLFDDYIEQLSFSPGANSYEVLFSFTPIAEQVGSFDVVVKIMRNGELKGEESKNIDVMCSLDGQCCSAGGLSFIAEGDSCALDDSCQVIDCSGKPQQASFYCYDENDQGKKLHEAAQICSGTQNYCHQRLCGVNDEICSWFDDDINWFDPVDVFGKSLGDTCCENECAGDFECDSDNECNYDSGTLTNCHYIDSSGVQIKGKDLWGKVYCKNRKVTHCSYSDGVFSESVDACDEQDYCSGQDAQNDDDVVNAKQLFCEIGCVENDGFCASTATSATSLDGVCHVTGQSCYTCEDNEKWNGQSCELDCDSGDEDDDGFYAEAYKDCGQREFDCDDENKNINPFAQELCTNTKDDNCDGNVNENCDCTTDDVSNCDVPQALGNCLAGKMVCDDDGQWGKCESIYEPVVEKCADDIDNNCDGKVDNLMKEIVVDYDDDGECMYETCNFCRDECGDFLIKEVTEAGFCDNLQDDDCDGFIDCQDSDCIDTDPRCDITLCEVEPECIKDEDCVDKDKGQGDCVSVDSICDGFCYYDNQGTGL